MASPCVLVAAVLLILAALAVLKFDPAISDIETLLTRTSDYDATLLKHCEIKNTEPWPHKIYSALCNITVINEGDVLKISPTPRHYAKGCGPFPSGIGPTDLMPHSTTVVQADFSPRNFNEDTCEFSLRPTFQYMFGDLKRSECQNVRPGDVVRFSPAADKQRSTDYKDLVCQIVTFQERKPMQATEGVMF
mmetsp:Transcript_89880/g.159921  ORF Transcript_89880/g.159921 Transcript_89880/m.159921 type:complete len:191 (-) Transcript_89880:98-670(-)